MHSPSSNDHRDQIATDGPPALAASKSYFLGVHAYCRELDDGAIILELATGTYIGIHAESVPDLRIVIRNWPNSQAIDRGVTRTRSTASEKLIADLLSRGILTTSPTPERSLTTTSPLRTLTITASAARRLAPVMYIPQFAMALLAVTARHQDKRLARLLDWLHQRQSAVRRHGNSVTYAKVMRLLASFFRLRIWFYTADRRCLFDSLVLANFLSRRKVPCTFVIGVSTKPFLAHSWVQIDAVVLNDTAEHVQTFTPILAIGESGQATTCFATS